MSEISFTIPESSFFRDIVIKMRFHKGVIFKSARFKSYHDEDVIVMVDGKPYISPIKTGAAGAA